MSAQTVHHEGPIIPMPPLTRDALREAVKRVSLVNLPQFDLEAGRAFDQASQTGSTAPLQLFLRRWGVFVAIERVRPVRPVCTRPSGSPRTTRLASPSSAPPWRRSTEFCMPTSRRSPPELPLSKT